MLQAVDATLRLEEARAAVARAEANVRFAESQHTLAQTTAQRYSALLATGDVSRTVADQASTAAETSLQSVKTARASLGEARAQLALAQQALSYVSVAAPFAGFISARHVSVGEYVQPSTPVVTLLKIDPLRLILAHSGGSGRTGRRRPGHCRGRGCISRPFVPGPHYGHQSGRRSAIACVCRRGESAQSGRRPEARHVRRRHCRPGAHRPCDARSQRLRLSRMRARIHSVCS